jgi:hypothetical protein
MVIRLSALCSGRALPPKTSSVTHFCQKLRASLRLEGLSKLKKFIVLIGTRTRDIPACSLNQPLYIYYIIYYKILPIGVMIRLCTPNVRTVNSCVVCCSLHGRKMELLSCSSSTWEVHLGQRVRVGNWGGIRSRKLRNVYPSPSVFRAIKEENIASWERWEMLIRHS